jgi:MurNAc alpha-1-phosphate uridylyltransferase
LTDTLPKPLIPVAGRAMLDRSIDALEAVGVERIVINSCHLGSLLEAHVKARRSRAELILSPEAEALETGGGIAQALPHFGEAPFFCVNGDIVWTEEGAPILARLAGAWHEGLDALLAMYPVARAIGYDGKGDFFMDGQGNLTRRGTAASAPYVYAVLQILHPRLFEGAPKGKFSLNFLYDKALAARPPRLGGLLHAGAWLHIGDVKSLQEAEAWLSACL